MRISNSQRAALRKAITAHPGWDAVRRARELSIATMSTGAVLSMARELGIDIDAAIRSARRNDRGGAARIAAGFQPFHRDHDAALEAAGGDLAKADALIAQARAKEQEQGRERAVPAFFQPSPEDRQARADAFHNAVEFEGVRRDLDALANAYRKHVQADKERIAALQEQLDQVAKREALEKLVVLKPAGDRVEIEGRVHPQFETLLKAVSATDARGNRLNVWIAGPAGSGKTHAAEQCAKTLGLAFGFHGAMAMAHELIGFVDGHGTYHETQFVKRFRDGGVCLLDEVDAGSNEAILALNAALANGMMSLPNGEIVRRHPDFICIAAANTFGQGATAEYIGRTKLDAAFLSRFPVKLSWLYDEALEQDICGNADWAREVQAARAVCADKGIKVVIDPRQSMAGAALLAAGMPREQVAELTYLANLTDDQKKLLREGMRRHKMVA